MIQHSQNLWSCGSISPKTLLIFPKNLLNFKFNTVEKQNIDSFSSKSYACVILSVSEVYVGGWGRDAVFCPFLYCILFIDYVEMCH